MFQIIGLGLPLQFLGLPESKLVIGWEYELVMPQHSYVEFET